MKKIKNLIDDLCFQFLCPLCVRCGSFFVKASFYCENCENNFLYQKIEHSKRLLTIDKKNYVVHSIISWPPYESDSLSEIVYQLKNSFSYKSWFYYSQIFSKLVSIDVSKSKKIGIIPVPSRKSKKSYHTGYFSRCMSTFYRSEILDCLVGQSSNKDQKMLNLNERQAVEVRFNEDFTSLITTYDHLIIVDDLITSGSTINACVLVLNNHISNDCKIDILALFSREKI